MPGSARNTKTGFLKRKMLSYNNFTEGLIGRRSSSVFILFVPAQFMRSFMHEKL
jgi:hypothetical protein